MTMKTRGGTHGRQTMKVEIDEYGDRARRRENGHACTKRDCELKCWDLSVVEPCRPIFLISQEHSYHKLHDQQTMFTVL